MPMTHSFPRPQLGDIFVRRNLNGNEEEAMVLSVQYHPKGGMWQATMNTKNGIEFVTGDAEHRNAFDWRPKGWVYDDQNGNWYSPEQKAKFDEVRAADAAKIAVAASAEPEHKDEFIVADAADITNAVTRKRLPGKLPVPQLPQV